MGKDFRRDINYYKVLQVDPGADPLVIKNAYYTILNQLKGHPDKGGDEETAKLINEAYHILSSADLRDEYDRYLLESVDVLYPSSFGTSGNVRVMERQQYRNGGRRFFLEELFARTDKYDNWLNEFFGLGGEYENQCSGQSWSPPVNIYRVGDKLVIKVEVPGVRREDIHIQFNEGILTVSGEKREEKQQWMKLEFQYGLFQRSFKLPHQVIPEKITSLLKDGILEIYIPIGENKRARIIPIT